LDILHIVVSLRLRDARHPISVKFHLDEQDLDRKASKDPVEAISPLPFAHFDVVDVLLNQNDQHKHTSILLEIYDGQFHRKGLTTLAISNLLSVLTRLANRVRQMESDLEMPSL
jgi:hypothetical protein